MDNVDPKAFEYALRQTTDGYIFEEFVNQFLSNYLSYEFTGAGGYKDRGIDGLEHTFHRKGFDRAIYQSSIEKNTENKLRNSIKKLQENKIKFDSFVFVTNQEFKDQDRVVDIIFDEFHVPIRIWDIKWLSSKVNSSSGTIAAYKIHVLSHLHEFAEIGKSFVVSDMIRDPRLFVFLRQQWDHSEQSKNLDILLVDSLILFALEGTNPEKNFFKTSTQIKDDIAKLISYDPKNLHDTIDVRLNFLSRKPRKINYHVTEKAYCLPYETRMEIQERNLLDIDLHESFLSETRNLLEAQLNRAKVHVRDIISLMESSLNKIFYSQGLEFSDFLLKGENPTAFEKDLYDTISSVVDNSPVIEKNKEEVKSALMVTIRQLVYRGSPVQKEFLRKLSNTYMMLFLLQCDPKLCVYFSSMASRLNIYVCTSILIPAISEFYLDKHNRRHWNLLKGARDAGVKLIINEPILNELIAHFQMITSKYKGIYQEAEDIYIGDEIRTLYVDDILIRAYFYAKMNKQVTSFHDFIDNFVSPDLQNAKDELRSWLQEEFGIKFVSDSSLGISVATEEEQILINELRKRKHALAKAATDAKLILTIHAIRAKNNEAGAKAIFGYKTWWLSKDIITQQEVDNVFKEKHHVSCYIRPDFLYNYISLAPKSAEVKEVFDNMFPSLLGINISFHLPSDIVNCVHNYINDHKNKNHTRLGAIISTLGERLKVDPKCKNRTDVKHFLDEQKETLLK
jgi:hypothetical protein